MIGSLALATTLALGCRTSQLDRDTTRLYADLLAKHVKRGRVAYEAMKEQDEGKLDRYLDAVAKAKLPEDRNLRIGFFVDAYNATVIKSVIAEGRPRSVLDVKGFFKEKKHTIAGKSLTLDELEKQTLNPYAKDPRTHFVLVCGAVGCPVLEPRPYYGTNMDHRMDAAARRYLASPTGARVSKGTMKLSMIFKWYEQDFGGRDGVIEFVKKHLPKEQVKKLGDSPKVEYFDYNWTLNQQ